MSTVKVVNDTRRDKPVFTTLNGLWCPIVRAHKNVEGKQMKVLDVRARYYNQDTFEFEEVELLELLDTNGALLIVNRGRYLNGIYAHIRRSNGEELHVIGSLICKKDKNGYAEPDYIF